MNREIELEALTNEGTEVEIRSADDSNARQIADIRYFAANGFDVIIAAPNEAAAVTPVIDSVMRAGIPVIVFDRNVTGDNYTAYQGADNDSIGLQAADYIYSKLGADARILEIYGNPESTPARGRHDGFVRGISAHPGMQIVATGIGDWIDERASAQADSLLALHPEVNVIYAHNDRMAMAAGEAAHRRGMKPLLIGVDAAPEIGIRGVSEGKLDATFLYPTEGNRLIQTALAIAQGKDFEKITKLPAASAVDKTNADILLIQNESIKGETQKIADLQQEVDRYWLAHQSQTTVLYASLICLILLFALVFLAVSAYWQKRRREAKLTEANQRLQHQRDQLTQLNEQLNAATQSKLMFFTNVSHDLRTPLTLISEPLRHLADASNLTPQQRAMAGLANKNVHILKRLINQILDFRKYENGRMELNLKETDICALIDEWTAAFAGVARQRRMHLETSCPGSGQLHLAIDVEKMERVFFNILSNAFKYTPDNGTIRVEVKTVADNLAITVSDNGRGIPEEDLGHIFDRFFQVDKISPTGSGIGLSLAKAFVELHGGTLTAVSQEGQGSSFTISIPVRHVAETPVETSAAITKSDVDAELADVDTPVNALSHINNENDAAADSAKPLLLAIDDNTDILTLLTGLLSDKYRVITAHGGAEGLRMACKYVPDIVVCDVMMPGMGGMECCERLKSEVSTSHIPVLMLTACSLDEQRVEGYEAGADGYVSKPFNSDVLLARCDSLVANRRRIRNLYESAVSSSAIPTAVPSLSRKGEEKPLPPKAGQLDNDFYRRFLDAFRAQMSNADLSVDTLASELGLGRSQFYRKIKALTNFSPVELMREIRLKEARQQLLGSDRNISEIAYAVGFSTPAYFTKCYREAFGQTPSETRAGVK